MLQAVAGPLRVCDGACDALGLRPRVCHVSWPSSACRAGAGTGSERCGSWSSPSTWMPLGSSSGARPPARVRCGGSGWPCAQREPMGGTRTSATPGPRGCWRWARGLQQRRKMTPSRCLCTSASLGGVRCDHGHGRWPPARGSRAPRVGGALGLRRHAIRPAQWPRRCWRTWGGSGVAGWTTGCARAVGGTDRVMALHAPVSSCSSTVPAAPGSAPDLA